MGNTKKSRVSLIKETDKKKTANEVAANLEKINSLEHKGKLNFWFQQNWDPDIVNFFCWTIFSNPFLHCNSCQSYDSFKKFNPKLSV